MKMLTTTATVHGMNTTTDQELVFSVRQTTSSSQTAFLNCSTKCLAKDILELADNFKMLDAVRDNEMRPIENLFETKTLWTALVLLSMILFTATGNMLVCIAVCRERKLQNNTNLFLISLAIADCMVALFVMPTGLIVEVIGHYPFSSFCCTIWISMDVLCCSSSIHHMSTMALDRYLTIRFPLRYGRNKSKRITLAKISCVWFISMCICSPLLILGILDERNVYDAEYKQCAPLNKNFKFYGSIFAFCIPLVIMLVAYVSTIRTLKSVLDRKLVDSKLKNTEKIRMLQRRTFSNIFEELVLSTTLHLNDPNIQAKLFPTVQNLQGRTTMMTNGNAPQLLRISSFDEEDELEQSKVSSKKAATSCKGYGTCDQTERPPQLCLISNPCIRVQVDENEVADDTPSVATDPMPTAQIKLSKDTLLNLSSGHDALSESPTSRKPSISERIHKSWTQLSASELSFKIISKSFNDLNLFKKSEKKAAATTNQSLSPSPVYPRSPVDETFEPGFIYSENELDCFDCDYSDYVMANLDRLKSLERSNLFMGGRDGEGEGEERPASLSNDEQDIVNRRLRSRSVFYSNESVKRKKRNSSANQIGDSSAVVGGSCSTSKLMLTSKSSVKLNKKSSRRGSFKLRKLKKRPSFKSSCKLLKSSISDKFRNSYTRIESLDSDVESVKMPAPAAAESTESPEKPAAAPKNDDFAEFNVSPLKGDFRYLNEIEERSMRFDEETYNLDSTEPGPSMAAQTESAKRTCRKPSFKAFRYKKNAAAAAACVKTPLTPQLKTAQILANHNHHPRIRTTFFGGPGDTQTSMSSSATTANRNSLYNPNFTLSNVAFNERKALKVLIIIFSVFVTLWSPFFLLNMASAVCEQCIVSLQSYQATVYSVLTWLGYSSSMANPVVYTMFNKSFRKAFVGILTCRKSFSSSYHHAYAPTSRYHPRNLNMSRAGQPTNNFNRQEWAAMRNGGGLRNNNCHQLPEESLLRVTINVPGVKTYTSIVHHDRK